MWIYYIFFLALCLGWILIRKKIVSIKISEKLFRKMVVLMCVANLCALGVEISENAGNERKNVEKIRRNSYGESVKQESYTVLVGEEEEQIEIQISPRIYEGEQLQSLFQDAKKELDKVILGENSSAEHVDQNLTLPTALPEFPFSISWELSRYDVVDLSGKLIQKEIVENDPDNQGIFVTLTGTLVYEEEEQQYQTEVLIFADNTEDIQGSILNKVEDLDKSTRDKEYLILPDEWNGQELIWKKEKSSSGIYLLMLSVVVSILLVFEEKQKQEERKRLKREEMMLDYPEIISQFTMLMSAGMTAKNVWKKLAEDYKRRKISSGKTRAAYEEILYTWQEMQSGIPEAECYERFAKRCELLPYMKMGALLSQNLRKGAKGIAEMLMMEAVEALEERRNRAKRLGEEAGTKLLLPMVIMLVVVLAIVVVPAFWSASL